MARILVGKREFTLFDFEKESELEAAVIEHKAALFGERSVYIDVKRRIGKDSHKGIPDAYLIDFFDPKKPQLYIVENELASHDVYSHITEQIARFSGSAISSANQIRTKLHMVIEGDKTIKAEVEQYLGGTLFRTILELLVYLTEHEVKIVLVINERDSDLNLALKIFQSPPDVVLLQRYLNAGEYVYYYEPMRDEVEESEQGARVAAATDFDTVVCAAFEDGFKHAYQENNAWWAIRLSQKARENLKYLAIYQKMPLAHIAHYAEIEKIEPYKDSGKYILYLKNKKVLKRPIPLQGTSVGGAPQSPRFTTLDKLLQAHTIGDLWK